MGTNSCIIVKISKEDKECGNAKFTRVLLPKGVKILRWDDQTIRRFNEKVALDGDYISIYCHWDGYPSGVGEALFNHYNNYVASRNLVCLGDLSSLYRDGVRPYCNRSIEKWEHIKPCVGTLKECKYNTAIWSYLFKNGKWYFKRYNWNRYRILTRECIEKDKEA